MKKNYYCASGANMQEFFVTWSRLFLHLLLVQSSCIFWAGPRGLSHMPRTQQPINRTKNHTQVTPLLSSKFGWHITCFLDMTRLHELYFEASLSPFSIQLMRIHLHAAVNCTCTVKMDAKLRCFPHERTPKDVERQHMVLIRLTVLFLHKWASDLLCGSWNVPTAVDVTWEMASSLYHFGPWVLDVGQLVM